MPAPAVQREIGSEPNAVLAIPARLNVFLALLAMGGESACLWIASQPFPLTIRFEAALAFSFVNNTVFSLLHEAVHGIFHPSPGSMPFSGDGWRLFFPPLFLYSAFFTSAIIAGIGLPRNGSITSPPERTRGWSVGSGTAF